MAAKTFCNSLDQVVRILNYNGINSLAKLRIEKLVNAINLGDLTYLYSALRDIDEAFRHEFARFVAANTFHGRDLALRWLTECTDSLTAVRSAAVSLLVAKLAYDGE